MSGAVPLDPGSDEPGPDEETGPERTCVVTRERQAPGAMIRFVAGPDGQVVPDIRRRLPGRGVWVSGLREIVAKAMGSGVFARGLKRQVTIPPGLDADIDRLLEADALQSLAMVNKAGLAVTGAAKVEAQIQRGDVAILLHAADGGPDGVRKMEQVVARAARASGAEPSAVAIVEMFGGAQMDLALGRTNVIHAALRRGAASLAFLERCERLARYRGDRTGVRRAGRRHADAAAGDLHSGARDD